jgi:hypothetical protein
MTEPPADWSAPSGPSVPPSAPGYGPPPGWSSAPTPWYAAPAPPQPGVIPLRPLAVGELLDGAIKVIRRYPRPTLGLSAAIAVVVTLISVAFVLSLESATLSLDDQEVVTGDDLIDVFSGALTLTLVLGAVSYLAGLVLTGALITVIGNAVQGKPAPMNEVWEKVRPRLLPLLGLSLLTGLIVAGPVVLAIGLAVALALSAGGGTLALTIPLSLAAGAFAVYVYTRLSLAPAALVLEKVGVLDAMRRSSVLVRSSWWRVFGITLLATVIAFVIEGIISAPIAIVTEVSGDSGSAVSLVLQQIGSGLASVLVAPFASGVGALLYVDRRMRAEGLDVALQAATGTGPSL